MQRGRYVSRTDRRLQQVGCSVTFCRIIYQNANYIHHGFYYILSVYFSFFRPESVREFFQRYRLTHTHTHIQSYQQTQDRLPSSLFSCVALTSVIVSCFRYGTVASVYIPDTPAAAGRVRPNSPVRIEAWVRFHDKRDLDVAMRDIRNRRIEIDGHTVTGTHIPPRYMQRDENLRRFY